MSYLMIAQVTALHFLVAFGASHLQNKQTELSILRLSICAPHRQRRAYLSVLLSSVLLQLLSGNGLLTVGADRQEAFAVHLVQCEV